LLILGLLSPALLLVGLSLYLLVSPWFRVPAPTPSQWLEAAHFVREGWQEGDVVRLEPAWMTRGRVYFGDLDGGSREPFRILDLHSPADPAYLYQYHRLWLVSAVEARGDYHQSVPPGATLAEEREFEALTVRRFQIPAGVIRWQMVAALSNARVRREHPREGPVDCPWRHKRHACSLGAQLDVQEALRQVAGSPRRCVLVRPGPGRGMTTVTFSDVESTGLMVLRVGNTVEAARARHGGDVTVEVTLDGRAAGRAVLDRRSYELTELAFPVAGSGQKELVISVQATDDRKREVCLDGYLLDTEVYKR